MKQGKGAGLQMPLAAVTPAAWRKRVEELGPIGPAAFRLAITDVDERQP